MLRTIKHIYIIPKQYWGSLSGCVPYGRRYILLIFVLLLLMSLPIASAMAQPGVNEVVRVGLVHFEPFIIVEDGEYSGFAIDLWEEVAIHLDHDYEYVEVATMKELLELVASSEVDLAVSAIDITTEHETYADFSFPYFRTGLQLMVHNTDPTDFVNRVLDVFSYLVSPIVIINLGGFLLVTLIVAHLFWLLERREHPDIPETYLHGIWEGFWWACVTVTTVGYGDSVPQGRLGRLLALIWIIAGLFLIANLTGSIAAEITVEELRNDVRSIADLAGKDVAVVLGDEGDAFIRSLGLHRTIYDTVEEAIAALQQNLVDAVVYESPVLRYQAEKLDDPALRLVGPLLNDEHFGFAFASNDPYREAVNFELLRMIEDGRYDEIHDRWFGTFASEG